MKAVICTKYGGPEVLQIVELPKPTITDTQVLVKVMATAVNSGDVRVRGLAMSPFLRIIMRIAIGFTKPRKPVLGVVLSGVVESVGTSVTKFKPGDEVYAMTGFKFGAYAEYAALHEDSMMTLKPNNASFAEAAAIVFGGATAVYFLGAAKIGATNNQRVLIYGATGAVGTAAVQIAKSYGAHVTAVCGEDGVALVRELGADEVIVYTKEDFTKQAIKYDIIFDAVGKTTKLQCASLLGPGGQYRTVGGLKVAKEKTEQLVFLRSLYERGRYKATIDKMYTLDEIVEAHRYVDSGRKKGNAVITVGIAVP